LTKNAGSRFVSVLDSVFAQQGVEFDVVAMDSGSTDGTVELLKRFPVDLHEIPGATFSHGGTRNRIAGLAHGSLLAFLTQDAIPVGTKWLATLAAALDDKTVAGAFGRQLPRPEARDSESYYQGFLYPSTPRRMVLEPGQRYRIAEFFFSNANSMIRRSVWQAIPFPEHVVMSEDQWWAREVLRRGYELAYAHHCAAWTRVRCWSWRHASLDMPVVSSVSYLVAASSKPFLAQWAESSCVPQDWWPAPTRGCCRERLGPI
jgi:rhamnosyltransferase